MKQLLINIINSIHLLLAFFLILGGYIIPSRYLGIYLLGCPFMLLDWHDGDELCHLTNLTNMVKYESLNPITNKDEDHFINSQLKKINIHMTNQQATNILYVLITLSWLYAYLRLVQIKHLIIFPNQYIKILVGILMSSWLFVYVTRYI